MVRIKVTGNHRRVMREITALKAGRVRKNIASAITDTLFAARTRAVNEWWPQSVKVRSSRFMSAALRIDRGRSATLRGALYDRLQRVSISYQTENTRRSGRGGRRAVPSRYAEARRLGGGKMRATLRPRAPGVIRQGSNLYKRIGRGKNAKLVKLYTLKKTVRQRKTFDFYKRALKLVNVIFPAKLTMRLNRELARLRAGP